ncbi:unnamed protein product [Adineta steineri]|uniref:G-protein coupled receptors family 1 profile domain-containing protein n=1 Tax=Adineta steineri TaxID=433720 RepID=A0A813RWZ2_9BILA|nr:unnamed protein product [Adineta steineri]CAF1414055.1 unnamed protein product [Adineta steineri]
MSVGEEFSFKIPCLFPMNETINDTRNSNIILEPPQSVLIAFHVGQIVSIFCIIFGILGNTVLIFAIYRSSFSRFSYGLLLFFIAIFDIVRLISTAYYYLLQAQLIPLNLLTATIYIFFYRYSKNITNWLKVFLAIERLLAVKYWISNRYNINSKNTTNIQRSRQKRILYLILFLFICTLISQHPNLIPNRYLSIHLDPVRLFLMAIPNPNFYYGQYLFDGALFIIMSYIIIDDLLPVTLLIIFNTILLYKLRHLPSITSQKIAESIWILLFLTVFSIFVAPRSFIVFCNLYVDPKDVNNTIIAIVFHTFQGLEMLNHAITGYACFLSCRSLRKTLLDSIHTICKQLQTKSHRRDNPTALYIIEPSNIVSKRP